MQRDEIAVPVPVPKHDHVSAADTTYWIGGCSQDERGASVHSRVHEDAGRALRDVCLSALHGCCEQAGKRELQDRTGLTGARPRLAAEPHEGEGFSLPANDEVARVGFGEPDGVVERGPVEARAADDQSGNSDARITRMWIPRRAKNGELVKAYAFRANVPDDRGS